ncbi:MAG TPA: type II toxin-antitoxin system PemK/MazF family toxin [Terriglobia bacterium]|nr:type II toxin-antitoxin system PemK/MazF family toxin [Terriglobia bacterium]
MKRGEIWWADLGPYRLREQTGRRPVVVWQSPAL